MASEHVPAIDRLIREFVEDMKRQATALESIAASLEKLANPPVVVDTRLYPPPRLPDDRDDPRRSPGWRDPHDAGRDR